MSVLDRLFPSRQKVAALERQVSELSGQRRWMAAELGNVTAKLEAYASRRPAHEEFSADSAILRRRLRGLYDNNELMAAVVDQVIEGMLQNDGILPGIETEDEELNREVEELFLQDADSIDLKNMRSLWELEATWIFEFMVVGESLDYWGVLDGRFFCEPFEAEQLASYGAMPLGQNFVSHGIEYDRFGRRLGYWMTPTHPGAAFSVPTRIDADRVTHWMAGPLRPTQWRGRSEFTQTAIALHDLSDADLAELTAMRAAAYFGLHIKPDPNSGAPVEATLPTALGATSQVTSSGVKEYNLSMKPGGVHAIPADVSLLDGKRPGNQYVPFHSKREQNLSARHRMPYHRISGEMKGMSYSTAAIAELISEQRFESAMQRLADKKLKPMFRAWLTVNWLNGRLNLRGYTPDEAMKSFAAQTNGFPWIDGANKARAIREKIELGVWTWEQVIQKYSPGKSPRKQLDALKKSIQNREESGVPIPLCGLGASSPDAEPPRDDAPAASNEPDTDTAASTNSNSPRNPTVASTNGRPRP